MNALSKLDDLKLAIESLERKSGASERADSVTLEDIHAIRVGINELANEFEEDIKETHHIFQSYKLRRNTSLSGGALGNVIEEDEEQKHDSGIDDETIAWLDENYGGNRRSMISPTRSPLDRFKMLGRLVKREIHESRKMGLQVEVNSLQNFEARRLSLRSHSISNLTKTALNTPKVAAMMERCWNITEFDIFELAETEEVRGHILVVFGSFLSAQFSWLSRYHLPKDKFNNFLLAIEKSYNDLPYHNKIHAIDVTHTLMHLVRTSIFAKHLSELDQLACFVAAVVHDVGHTGQTNQYHINSLSQLAIRYNDRSVLENYHLSLAFQLLREPQNNFMEPLTKEEQRYVRDAVITMVLGTDLHFHQKQLKKLRQFSKVMERQETFDLQTFTDSIPRVRDVVNEKLFLMELALHLVDISNPCKKTSVSVEWTRRITLEFFDQGDLEKAQDLPVSAGCDRDANKNMARQSIGFIDFIVLPLWSAYYSIDAEAGRFVEQIQRNRAHWMDQMEQTTQTLLGPEVDAEHCHDGDSGANAVDN